MSWASPIIAIALMFGVLAGVLTWVAGPSKGIFAVGKAGYLPPFFQKANKNGVQRNILLIQGGVVTLLALLFVVMPSVQSFYQILSQLTVLLYLIMYMLMFSAAIVLRYKMKELNRPFRLGKGNGLMWLLGVVGFLGALLAFVLSFVPPSQISTGSNTVWFSVLIIGCLIVVGAPFVIYSCASLRGKTRGRGRLRPVPLGAAARRSGSVHTNAPEPMAKPSDTELHNK